MTDKTVVWDRAITLEGVVDFDSLFEGADMKHGDDVRVIVRRGRPKKLDWSKLPSGTLLNTPAGFMYFREYVARHDRVVCDTAMLARLETATSWCHLSHNFSASAVAFSPDHVQPWQPWFGSAECPFPDGVKLRLRTVDANKKYQTIENKLLKEAWQHEALCIHVIAYKIIGLDEGWTY